MGNEKDIWLEIERKDTPKWEEIKNNLNDKTYSEQLKYLYSELGNYISSLDFETLNASAIIKTKFPSLNNFFLDRKINAKIEEIRGLISVERLEGEEYIYRNEEPIEVTSGVSEIRTKLLLLNELGIIKKLKVNDAFVSDTELCKLLAELFETKEENKSKSAESIRTDLRYINQPNNAKYPYTSQAKKKVNSILTSFGLPTITED